MANRCDDITDFRTICEVHREIYTLTYLDGDKSEILAKLEEAYSMAKRMNAKLRQYNKGYDNEWYERQKKPARVLREQLREKLNAA
jgi:hypothetical protein